MAHKLVTSFSYAFSENIDLHHLVIIDPRLKYAGMIVGVPTAGLHVRMTVEVVHTRMTVGIVLRG